MRPRVAVIVADGVNMFELSIASSTFGSQAPDGNEPWYDFAVCSPRGHSVDLANGLRLSAHEDYAWAATADTVIVPAWPTAMHTLDADALEFVGKLQPDVTRIVSFCSGAFLLAEAGLLDGRVATTHWLHAERLQLMHPEVRVDQDRIYTEDANIFTSAGSSTALDLSLFLVSIDYGADRAAALARRLALAPHRSGGQNQYARIPAPQIDDINPVGQATDWALENLDQTIRLRDLANRANMSQRTFSRQFEGVIGMSPINWVLLQRVERAKQLLETTDLSVPRVATAVGLGSDTNLRQHFGRHVGVSPTAYRQSFALTF